MIARTPDRPGTARTRVGWALVLFVLAILAGRSAAADEAPPAEAGPELQDRDRALVMAACVVGSGNPANVIGLLEVARATSLWSDFTEKVVEQAPNLALNGVTDQKPLLTGGKEQQAYCEVLLQAHKLSDEAFARSALRDVTYVHLYEQPQDYRGKVIHRRGRMRRLTRFEAPEDARVQGLLYLYEGWLFDPDTYGANPVCVVFTDLPKGMKPGETVDYPVTFDGYFFKRYRYKAADHWRDAPLLIGHSPVLVKNASTAPVEGDSLRLGKSMVTAFLWLVAGTLVVTVGLGWWYRRADRRIKQRIAGTREVNFQEPTAEE